MSELAGHCAAVLHQFFDIKAEVVEGKTEVLCLCFKVWAMSAPRSSDLVGMQPQFRQTPPKVLFLH